MSFILLEICAHCPCFLVIITSFREGQQNPASEALLLPLRLVGDTIGHGPAPHEGKVMYSEHACDTIGHSPAPQGVGSFL